MRVKTPKIFTELTLNRKIQVLFLGVVFVNLIFLGVFLIYLNRHITEYSMRNDQKILESSMDILNADIKNVNNVSKMITTNDAVRSYLGNTDPRTDQDIKKVQAELYKNIYLRDYIGSVYVIAEDGSYTSVSAQWDIMNVERDILSGSSWKKMLDEKKGRAIICYNGAGAFELKTGEPVMSYARAVYDLDTQKKIGYLVINLNQKFWEGIFQQQIQNESQGIRIEDGEGNCYFEKNLDTDMADIFAGKTKDYNETITYHRKPYNLLLKDLTDYNLRIFFQDSDTRVLEPVGGFTKVMIIYLLFSIAALILIRHVIRKNIVQPIEKLVNAMTSVQEGWLKRASIETNHDEIGLLKDSYNNMLIELNRLFHDLMEQESEKYKLELDLLQEQINPHFLYNTLYSIEYMALEHQDMEVYSSLQALGDFYRNFLSKGRREIPLAEEIQIIQDYLKLQALRFSDIFETTITVQESIKDCLVLRLILQPLVENCIYHGVRPKGELCTISIDARQVDDQIHLTVMDTGIGMDQEKVEEIFRKESKKSFGLKSTIERIRLFYEIEDVYEIHSEVGEYTRIMIKIPLKRITSDEQTD